MKSAYAYIRVSTVKQGERGSSLQEQKAAIEAYARRNDLEILQWFEEKETAAKRGRRVFNRVLGLLARHPETCLIIHKIDRSARNLRDWADLGVLIDRGVDVQFAHESLDLQTRGGRLSADIQAVVAADFIRNLRDEVRKGFYGRLKQGFYPLPAPVGYLDHGGGKVKTPDPVMAPLIRQAFELYSTGRFNLRTLGSELHRVGLRNRNGGRVSRNGLSTVLNNQFYMGIISIEKTGERFDGKHQPLISSVVFNCVQERLTGRTKHLGLKHDLLYRKTFRCFCCGDVLIGEKQKTYVYYRCHRPTCPRTCLREEHLGGAVSERMWEVKFYEEDYPYLVDEFHLLDNERLTQREGEIASLTLRLGQVEERLERLTDAFVDGAIDKELFEVRKQTLLRDRIMLRETRDQLSAGNDPRTQRGQKFLELLQGFCRARNSTNCLIQRETLKSASSNLLVDQEILHVRWKPVFQVLVDRGNDMDGRPYRATDRTSLAQESQAHPSAVNEPGIEASIGLSCSWAPPLYQAQGRRSRKTRLLTPRQASLRRLAKRLYQAIAKDVEENPDEDEACETPRRYTAKRRRNSRGHFLPPLSPRAPGDLASGNSPSPGPAAG